MSRSTAWIPQLRLATWAVLTTLLVGECNEAAPKSPLSVEWGHCRGMMLRASGLVCVYDPSDPVRLWVDDPRAREAHVWIDEVEVAAETYSLAEEPQGGGLRVAIPPGAHALAVAVQDEHGVRRFELRLEPHDPEIELPGTLEAELAVASWATGDVTQIEQATLHAVEVLLAAGRVGDAVNYLCGASFKLRILRRFDRAAQLLERAEAIGSTFAAGRGTVANYRGHLAWSQGALHEAAVELREGARVSLRLEDAMGLADGLPIYAETLAELGYYDEALHFARESLRHLPEEVCDRATVLRTTGWIDRVLRARGQPHDDPRPRLEQAIALYRTEEACAHQQGGARLSLALLAHGDGDPATARRELAQIDVERLSAVDRVRAADLKVQLQLGTEADPAAAWQAWKELDAAARAIDDDDARWRVDVRHGELLARQGDAAAALRAFERAERHLDRLVRAQAVVGVGRAATADRYLEGTTALVSLLVAQGRHARAFCVTREARARRRSAVVGAEALPAAERAQVEAKIRRYREQKRLADESEAQVLARPQDQAPTLRHEAERSARAARALVDEIVESLMRATATPRCEQLVPPAPGELLVGFHPREHDWLVFVHDAQGTQVHEVPVPTKALLEGDPAALGERLLGPIDTALAGASRVRVLADREAQAIDVHALPWRGLPLAAAMPVTYGVELPARPDPARAAPLRALLLTDATGTLTSAPAEIEMAGEQLGGAGWQVDAPATDDPDAPFEPSFEGYSLLHYAAHTATPPAGSQVWAPYAAGEAGGLPHLRIGPTSRLEVHDILAGRPVPPVAFLAGCKTGLVELDTGSTSVALAFLLADGQQVVASRENVDDAEGLAIARRFYAFFGRGDIGLDAAAAMHETQRALSQAGEGAVPYRVWVR